MISRSNQVTLMHCHVRKREDIINRGGGVLVVQLYNKAEDGGLDTKSDVTFYTDGIKNVLPAGSLVEVTPGNSITLEPYVFHKFYAKRGEGLLIVGEVSKVNDDNNDNVFYNPLGRFSEIEEDEKPVHLLVNEDNF